MSIQGIYKTWNMLLAAQNLKAFVKLEQIYSSYLFLISSFFICMLTILIVIVIDFQFTVTTFI